MIGPVSGLPPCGGLPDQRAGDQPAGVRVGRARGRTGNARVPAQAAGRFAPMPADPDPYVVATEDALLALYPTPVARTWAKESDFVTPGYAELIAASPFCVLATRGAHGIDCSPRGDGPGFVDVIDPRTLVIRDRRGNNRLDTLRNLLFDNAIGLIFVIPGIGEAVRVRGTAAISTDPDLLARYTFRGAVPVTALVVTVTRIYFQCRRAALRSSLWNTPAVDPASLPTPGRLQAEVGAMAAADAAEYDAVVADYTSATLYSGPTRA